MHVDIHLSWSLINAKYKIYAFIHLQISTKYFFSSFSRRNHNKICRGTGKQLLQSIYWNPTSLRMTEDRQFSHFLLQKTWCVAKPSSDEATLERNLDYACGKVDCSVLQKDGPCFDPHTFISHASIAMNLYYQAHESNPSSCDFKKSAIVVITDPSNNFLRAFSQLSVLCYLMISELLSLWCRFW